MGHSSQREQARSSIRKKGAPVYENHHFLGQKTKSNSQKLFKWDFCSGHPL